MKEMKVCNQCNKEKPLKEFYKNKATKDGYRVKCKICENYIRGNGPFKITIDVSTTTKICTKCKKEKILRFFRKDNNGKYGFTSVCTECARKIENKRRLKKKEESKNIKITLKYKKCSTCNKTKDINEFGNNIMSKDLHTSRCKKCIIKADKNRKERNREINKNRKVFVKIKTCCSCKTEKTSTYFHVNLTNPDGLSNQCKKCHSGYYRKNKKEINRKKRENYQKNKHEIIEKKKNSKVYFSTYGDRLTVEESAIDDGNGILMCKCAFCKEYHYPLLSEITARIGALEGKRTGEHRLYCTQKCKKSCPIFWKSKYIKGSEPRKSSKTSKYRCNQSRVREVLLDLQFEEFGHQYCEKCGEQFPKEDLYFHHNVPIADNPSEYDNASHYMVVCKDCHTHNGCLQND